MLVMSHPQTKPKNKIIRCSGKNAFPTFVKLNLPTPEAPRPQTKADAAKRWAARELILFECFYPTAGKTNDWMLKCREHQ